MVARCPGASRRASQRFPSTSPCRPAGNRIRVTRAGRTKRRLGGPDVGGLCGWHPLVTEMPEGAGRVVLFHITANADWSDLPLSGLFVDMLRRLVDLFVGVATTQHGDAGAGRDARRLWVAGRNSPPAASSLQGRQIRFDAGIAATSAGVLRTRERPPGAGLGTSIGCPGSGCPDQRRHVGNRSRFSAGARIGATFAGACDP